MVWAVAVMLCILFGSSFSDFSARTSLISWLNWTARRMTVNASSWFFSPFGCRGCWVVASPGDGPWVEYPKRPCFWSNFYCFSFQHREFAIVSIYCLSPALSRWLGECELRTVLRKFFKFLCFGTNFSARFGTSVLLCLLSKSTWSCISFEQSKKLLANGLYRSWG